MYLKKIFLAIGLMTICTMELAASASSNDIITEDTVKTLLNQVMQAHNVAVVPFLNIFTGKTNYLTLSKSINIATRLTSEPAIYGGFTIFGLLGVAPGFAMLYLSPDSKDEVVILLIGGALIGTTIGAVIGGFGNAFFWDKFLTGRVTRAFTRILENASPQLREKTVNYLNSKSDETLAEIYLAGDEKSLSILKTLLTESLRFDSNIY
jgi:hypothetical protein